MQPLTSLRTMTAAASLALVGVLAAAPQASAAISGAAVTTPVVLDNGKSLSVPINVNADQAADTAAARNVTDALVGGWLGDLVDYAERNAPATPSTCSVTATATDPDGAAGTASAAIPAGTSLNSLTIPDQAHGTTWGVGDVDHFTVKLVCSDTQRNAQLNQITIDQDAIAS